jgi:hypothetical protein
MINPKDGQIFQIKFPITFRWKAYSPKSLQWKAGKRGRFQEANEYGGWFNTEYSEDVVMQELNVQGNEDDGN